METPTPSPPQISSGRPKIIKYMTQSAENFVTPTNIKSPLKSRTITLSALDILGFADVDVTLGIKTLEKVKMLVFKNSTNPCLIGRDVLAVHLVIKANFEALMSNEYPTQPLDKDFKDELREYLRTSKIKKCKSKHCDKISEDDGDEMEDLMYDSSNVKGCWSKNKSRIDQDAINTKVPINMDRKMCASKINNSIEKRTSIIENIYDCSKDHRCGANRKEINALDYPTTPSTTPAEGNIFIQALEIIMEDSDNSEEELISEDESIEISPDISINTNNQPRGGR